MVIFSEQYGSSTNRISPSIMVLDKKFFLKYRRPSPFYEHDGQHVLFERRDDSWRACYFADHESRKDRSPVRWKKPHPELKPQQIELKGKISDAALQKILRDAVRVKGMPEIVKTIHVKDDHAVVSGGNYPAKVPDSAITLERHDERWRVVRHFSILNFQLDGGFHDFSELFPLRPKPKPERLADVIRTCKAPKKLTKKEVEQICEFVLRYPGRTGAIRRIQRVNKNTVHVITGSFFTDKITMEKVGDQWVYVYSPPGYF